MGASITTLTEVKTREGDWVVVDSYSPFAGQNTGIFAFLANFRNDFMLTPVTHQNGFPEGHESVEQVINLLGDKGFVSRYPDRILDGHFPAHVYLSKLVEFNYDQQFENLRNYGPGLTDSLEPGEGVMTTYRELLGHKYFADLESLKEIGEPCDIRVILVFQSVL